MYWGVSFSSEKHVLFNDIPKGDSKTEKKKLNGFEAAKTIET